ncbi:HAMP domain-containing sensor histidine kinase [Nonomuraea dietziae]|uniref:sensor histidine kinase n=1 Tax=Nonomuraea dietziae TaxID=65515 RepID=UPI0033FFEC24
MTVATVALFGAVLLAGVVTLCLSSPSWARAQLVDRADEAGRMVTTLIDVPLLAAILGAAALVLLALTGWAAWIGVGRVLAPVERIRAGLEQISATDLGDRMPVPDTGDEVARLAITVNDTLGRLEDAVERQRRFVSDASHELRTPLTAMLVRLEACAARPDPEECARTLEEALGDARRLSAIVQDLLLMARLDAGTRPTEELLDLGKLVVDEMDRRPFRLPFTTCVEPRLMVRGNRLRLDRLLTSLLSNADRHGCGAVHVTVSRCGDEGVVEVYDDGPGIPEDQREAVFQRFTRLDTARSRDHGGTGLGLPIARDIATAHGGTLRVGDSAKGARLVLRLPLAPPTEEGQSGNE